MKYLGLPWVGELCVVLNEILWLIFLVETFYLEDEPSLHRRSFDIN